MNLGATSKTNFRPSLWAGCLGLALLFALLRWNNFNAPLTRDEGEYAYAAQLLRDGGLPYEQSFLQKPPMVAYTYALAHFLAPDVFWSPRVLAAVFAALATGLVGFIARREFGPASAFAAMWLMTPMILLPGINQFIANTEMFMLLPLMATVAIYIRHRDSKSSPWHWFAAGGLAATTVCYKYTAFPLVAFVLAAWIWEEWRGKHNPRRLASFCLAAFLGATTATLCILAPFLLSDGGKHLWECTVTYNRYYAATSGFGPAGLWQKLLEFWRSWWVLFLAPLFLILKPDARFGIPSDSTPGQLRLWFWIPLFLLGWVVSAGSGYGHYYIPVMPVWALLSAAGLRNLAVWIAPKISKSSKCLQAALTTFALLLVCLPDVSWVVRSPEQFARDRLGSWSVFLESAQAGARLAQLTSGWDRIYVAGSEPQILTYAHRASATRFDIAYPLMIPTPLAQSYQDEAIRDLGQNPPAAILLVRSPSSWLTQSNSPTGFLSYLHHELIQHYQIVGGCRADVEPPRWQEPMGQEDLVHCSLVLFQRKAP